MAWHASLVLRNILHIMHCIFSLEVLWNLCVHYVLFDVRVSGGKRGLLQLLLLFSLLPRKVAHPHKFPKYFYMHYLVYLFISMGWKVLLLCAKPPYLYTSCVQKPIGNLVDILMLCKSVLFKSLNSTKLIYHLGGFGLEWLYELSVVPRGYTDGIFTCGLPPRNKGTKVFSK